MVIGVVLSAILGGSSAVILAMASGHGLDTAVTGYMICALLASLLYVTHRGEMIWRS